MEKKFKCFAYVGQWQYPAKTEQAAYESIVSLDGALEFDYLAFPWATLIDALDTKNSRISKQLLNKLAHFNVRKPNSNRLVTVCQHIKLLKYLPILKGCGVTDIFWPHKVKSQNTIANITLHPFPLYPAQTNDLTYSESKPIPYDERKYLTSFIGSYGKGYYLSDTRLRIFEDIGKFEDVKIIERKGWHFGTNVYEEQMKGLTPKESQLQQQEREKLEYIELMKQSKFTLCPTGSGPNSIRLFESIQLGSIPVVLTKGLHLPGDIQLWKDACVIVEDSGGGYVSALEIMRSINVKELEKKYEMLKKINLEVSPTNYAKYIFDVINGLFKK